MKIFITGATGFIGKNLVARLVNESHDVICGGRSFAGLGPLLEKVKSVYIDLEHRETIGNVLKEEKPDVVYHTAALVKSRSLEGLMRVNAEGTRNVLGACFNEGINKVIHVSSVAVIAANDEVPLTDDMPLKARNPYGQSKLAAEKVALDYRRKGLKVAIIRPSMVYGKNEPHGLGMLVNGIKWRMLPVFGKGNNRIHLVSVENVVDVMLLCLSKEAAYDGTYIIADKETLTAKELFEYIAEVVGAKPPFVIPEKVTAVLGKLPLIKHMVSMFAKERYYSIKALREKLGYVPRVSVYEGLKEAVLPYRERR